MNTLTNEQALKALAKMQKSLQIQLAIAESKASPEQRKRLFSNKDYEVHEVDEREMMGFI